MKILYSWGHGNKREKSLIEAEIKRWLNAGYDITPINDRDELGIDNPWAPDELDRLYRNKDNRLLKLYNKVRMLAKAHDVFIVNYGNVYHPEFVKSLKDTGIYSVIYSGDDPESSDFCSKPYVYAFDHAFAFGINFNENTKITEKFLEWGVKRADWWPYGAREDMYNSSLTEDDIYNKRRDIDLIFVGTPWLKLERIAKLKRAFPQMKIYGQRYWKTMMGNGINALRRGKFPNEAFKAMVAGLWRIKELPANELVPLYQRCEIGINMHLSFGPSNVRTYQLPANGAMQICDCPEGLGEVFEVGKEVITYHSIEEAIELIRYYLDHEEERRKIAAAGFKRVMKDYKAITTFSNAIEKMKKGMLEDGITSFKDGVPIKLNGYNGESQ
jgi:spore maturation protein CgeB